MARPKTRDARYASTRRRGVVAYVSPGAGPLTVEASEDHAAANVRQLLDDARQEGLDQLSADRRPALDGGGRFGFRVRDARAPEREVEVLMPGLTLAEVRWLGEADQNIWDFPRLYVAGSSWVWKFAIGALRSALLGEE